MSAPAEATRVKVCGLTLTDDVEAAVAAGAWAVGFILTRSPRQVTPAAAAVLVRAAADATARRGAHSPAPADAAALSGGDRREADGTTTDEVLTVAVFTTESAAEIAETARVAGVSAVQLSGGVDGPGCAAVRAAMRAAGCRPAALIAAPDCAGSDTADYVLLDSRYVAADADGDGDGGDVDGQTVYGGTGRPLDWDQLELPLDRRVVLAGGITPASAPVAIRRLRPYAIDVSSGIETSPGVKDHEMLAALFDAVAAENQTREPE